MNEILYLGVCDDEQHIHDIVEEKLKEYGEEKQLTLKIFHFYSGRELIESEQDIQILLLDIDMPQMDGIETAYHLTESGKECRIIMLTSKQERFKEAFKIGAYRFVTKPIDLNELYEALDDTRKLLLGYEEIELKFNSVPCKIRQRNIDYIEASRDYVKVYVGDKVCESDRALKYWEENLDSRLFVECHKSYIVNLENIKKLKKNSLILEKGTEIPIARRRKNEVVRAIMRYNTKNY